MSRGLKAEQDHLLSEDMGEVRSPLSQQPLLLQNELGLVNHSLPFPLRPQTATAWERANLC